MATFILNDNTYKLFIYRFNQLLNKSGCVVGQSEYSGKKIEYNQLKKIGFKGINLPVKRTIPLYIHKDKIVSTFRKLTYKRKEYILMNMAGGHFFNIDFGTRIYTDNNKLSFKTPKTASLDAHTTEIKSFYNTSKALREIAFDEQYEQDYINDYFSSLD